MTDWVWGLPPATGKDEVVALDLETFRNNPKKLHRPVGELAVAVVTVGDTSYLMREVGEVRRAVERIKRSVVALQHAPYDIRYLDKWGIPWEKLRIWDTELAEKVATSGLYSKYALDDLARRKLDVFLDKSVRNDFGGEPFELGPKHLQYTADDGRVTRLIALQQLECFDPGDVAYYWTYEYPALVALMHCPPIPVDVGFWTELYEEAGRQRQAVRDQVDWNPGSWQQIKDQVWRAYKIDLPSTEYEVLEGYQRVDRPLIDLVLQYKDWEKAETTYGAKWLEDHLEDGDVVWSDGHVSGTETHRITWRNPGMTQIPVRKRPEYRRAFPASRGRRRIKQDADQQEPRVGAYLSQDPALLAALHAGVSTHVQAGIDLFGIKDFSKKHPLYPLAKQINLGVMYNLSAAGLARDTKKTLDECEVFIRKYFMKRPGIAKYHNRTKANMRRLGYVRSPGEGRYFGNPYSSQFENNAVNGPIQMGAAEITKLALAYTYQMCADEGLAFTVDMVVYDELGANCPTKDVKKMSKLMERAWTEAAAKVIPGIPFAVETSVGRTWGG